MDSLLANYASSDDEEERPQQEQNPIPSKTASSGNSTSSLFASLPQPKSCSSSHFQSLPQPKQSSAKPSPLIDDEDADAQTSSKFSESGASLFSSLPNPKLKSQIHEQPKKVVQFKPPIIPLPKPSELDDEDDIDDEEEEEEEERSRNRKLGTSTQAPSVKSFLSSIPAPRNSATLGVQPSSSSGRRSIIEMEAPVSNSSSSTMESSVAVDHNAGDYVNYESYNSYQYGTDQNAGSGCFLNGASYGNYGSGVDQSVEAALAGTASYGSNDDAYASYGDYGQYGNNWIDGSAATVPEASGFSDNSAVRFPRKRGRHEIPSEIIEVKQEELIKNRPREDQVKLTGIAFGPSYQPVSAKGKPSKLHKRKHQIGSLYFDMKQNEMKLAERRAKGMLTKAETQAKYGW